MQCIDLHTSVCVRVTVGVVAGEGVGLSVAVHPGVAFAFRDGDGGVRRVVDGQVQGDH